ncbi:MAG: enhanced intracellular survival protein Eis [Enterococcus sp.]
MSGVRELGTSAEQEMFELASYAFNKEQSNERRKRFHTLLENSWNYGFFNKENYLVSQVIATPFPVNFHGRTYQMAGIGSVSSYPESRGQGAINKIMKQLLRDCREKGIALSYLAPFSYPFYRRYGYELVFEKANYRVTAADWPVVKQNYGQMIRCTLAEAIDKIDLVYKAMPIHHRGALEREEWWQAYKFQKDEKNKYALYKDEENKTRGYIVYKMEGTRFHIVEWGYLDHHAFSSLVQFVGAHASSFQEIMYSCGDTGSGMNYLFASPLAEMQIVPEMMARIVDLQKFIEEYPFQEAMPLEFSLEVTADAYGEWNEGTYIVNITAGEAMIQKGEQPELPMIRGDIQGLTQLFLGYRSPEELAFHEKIDSSDTYLIEQLTQVIPQQRPVLEDYF